MTATPPKLQGVERRREDPLEPKFGGWFMEVVRRVVLQPLEMHRARHYFPLVRQHLLLPAFPLSQTKVEAVWGSLKPSFHPDGTIIGLDEA